MMDNKFQVIMNQYIVRYKILKESKRYEECIEELEKIVLLMSQAVIAVFGKMNGNLSKPDTKLLQGVVNVNLADVINPDNTITIDQNGVLKIKS